MNKEMAKALLVIAIRERKDQKRLKEEDLKNIIVFKRKILKEETFNEFFKQCIDSGLITKLDDRIEMNFNWMGIKIPVDFSVSEEDLFSDQGQEETLFEKLLNIASSSELITKREALRSLNNILPNTKYSNNVIKLCALMNDLYIDFSSLYGEIEAEITRI
ncbi:DUF2240 family protein [Caldiplasma sukawensis]